MVRINTLGTKGSMGHDWGDRGNYRYIATSVAGFIQQLAVAYITHGYFFYVTGRIQEGKNVNTPDAKLIAKRRSLVASPGKESADVVLRRPNRVGIEMLDVAAESDA